MSKCEETECLVVDIYEHPTQKFTYNVFNGHEILGQLIEDDITKVLSSKEVKGFYNQKHERFLVNLDTLNKTIVKPKCY